MPTIADFLRYSETAFAAYAVNLVRGIGINETELVRAGMAIAEAGRFDVSWEVLDQQDLTDGFFAVLLQPVDKNGKPAGEKVLAIRGSESRNWGVDYFADVVNIALLGATFGMSQYGSLRGSEVPESNCFRSYEVREGKCRAVHA